jgi:hypothetical protein
MASFTPRPLYPVVKSPQCPLYRRLGGPHSVARNASKANEICYCDLKAVQVT